VEDLGARIDRAVRTISAGREVLLIEGTGHAGVGAVIGLSNADVAARLGAPALIVSEAGVGRPIDEIVLNAALFERRGVPILGAVVNKVDAEADPSLPDLLRRGLARHGIDLLGVLPYRAVLSNPTLAMLVEQMHGEMLHPGDDLDRVIEHVAIGAMHPRHVLERIGPGSLLILPGDRHDIVVAALAAQRTHAARRDARRWARLRYRSDFGRPSADPGVSSLAGIVFTAGLRPRDRDLEAIREAGLFAYVVEAETYAAASEVHDLLVKTHPADSVKIEATKRLVIDHFDVDALLGRLDDPSATTARPGDGVDRAGERTGEQAGRGLRGVLERGASRAAAWTRTLRGGADEG
jgi:BioD-like phosphotransacetylase family protein